MHARSSRRCSGRHHERQEEERGASVESTGSLGGGSSSGSVAAQDRDDVVGDRGLRRPASIRGPACAAWPMVARPGEHVRAMATDHPSRVRRPVSRRSACGSPPGKAIGSPLTMPVQTWAGVRRVARAGLGVRMSSAGARRARKPLAPVARVTALAICTLRPAPSVRGIAGSFGADDGLLRCRDAWFGSKDPERLHVDSG